MSENDVMDSVQETKELLRIIGHRVSTPLTDILQIADAITYGAEGEVSQPIRESVLKMRASAEQVLAITERILGLVSVESLRERPSTIDIAEMVQYIHNLVLPLVEAHNRQIILDLPPTLPLVNADDRTLQQALHILFAIAIDLARSNTILVSAALETHFVVVTIQDNFSSETQQRLSVGEVLRALPTAELGLDLWFCRRVAEMAGGEFWLTGDLKLGNIAWHNSWPISENNPL
jgi:signal transduction histidine kinase